MSKRGSMIEIITTT